MRDKKIRIEKKFNIRKFRNDSFKTCRITLKINNEWFNPDHVTKHAKRIEQFVQKKYWETIEQFYIDGCPMIVKLNGLHFDIYDLRKYVFQKDGRTNMVLHYHDWEMDDITDSECYAFIECDKKMLKELFDRFWFALGYEQRFRGFVVNPRKKAGIKKWFRQNRRNESDLKTISLLTFDNCTNGFHFQVNLNTKYSIIMKAMISALDTIMVSSENKSYRD